MAVRNLRRTANEDIKKLEKAGDYTEDDVKETEEEVKKAVEKAIKDIDEIVAKKDRDIMTNVDTHNIKAAVRQTKQLMDLGCDIMRIAVPDKDAALAFGEIKKQLPDVPIVADIHFDYELAIAAIDNGADAVRINPGNIGSESRVRAVVWAARRRGIPLRIGVNSGSLEKDILDSMPPSLKYSEAARFSVKEGRVVVPISGLNGVGDTIARSIMEAQEDRPFATIEDMRRNKRIEGAEHSR